MQLFAGHPKAFDDALGPFLLLTAEVLRDRQELKASREKIDSIKQRLQLEQQQLRSDQLLLQSGQLQLKADKERLQADRESHSRDADTLVNTVDRARKFLDAWTGVPEAERTPQVNAAANAATGLTREDLQPGFQYPGRGGQSAAR